MNRKKTNCVAKILKNDRCTSLHVVVMPLAPNANTGGSPTMLNYIYQAGLSSERREAKKNKKKNEKTSS